MYIYIFIHGYNNTRAGNRVIPGGNGVGGGCGGGGKRKKNQQCIHVEYLNIKRRTYYIYYIILLLWI